MRNGFKFLFLFGSIFLSFAHAFANQAKQICLVLVVKDDETVIEKCLTSVKGLVDCICICDLGSTDDTMEIIHLFKKNSNIPMTIQHLDGGNVHKARSLCCKSGQKFLTILEFELAHSYLLCLDPDMTLKVSDNFNKNSLSGDSYLLFEESSIFSYYTYNRRLLRASLMWEDTGHGIEHWSSMDSQHSEKLTTLRIESNMDDARKQEKLKTYCSVLTETVKQHPKILRETFHLAQTFKSLKKINPAIQWYLTRIQLESSSEEAWFCKLMLGECYEEIDQWDQALHWYLDAFDSHSHRVEPLRNIATHYRLRGKNELAYLFAKHASRLPLSQDQTLFPLPSLKRYQLDEELSISSYYTRFRDDGYTAVNNLILSKEEMPWHIREQAFRNALFYVQNLKARFQPIHIDLPFIQMGSEERYHPMNPSIIKTENGYTLICRAVNYTQKGAKTFSTTDSTGVFRTRNFLIDFDKEFRLSEQHEIIENLPRMRFPAFNVEGLEDCRLFKFKDNLCFTCTTCDTNPTGDRQISLCLLDKKLKGNEIHVENLVPLKGPDPSRCEKNWLPFIQNDELFVVYSYDPFVIYKPNPDTGECEVLYYRKPHHNFSSFRGSAAPILFDDGYLILVHEVCLLPEYYRCYLHRFLYLDRDFNIVSHSKPFTFMHQGVEYCCSMTIDHSGNQLILPIGIEDHEAYLCFVNLDTIRSLLIPLPSHFESSFGN